LARSPDDRYSSAGELASDLRHYLAGETLSARAPTIRYLLRSRFRQHTAGMSIAAGVGAMLLIAVLVQFPRFVAAAGVAVVVAIVLAAYVQVRRQRDEAIRQRHRSESLVRVNQALNQRHPLEELWRIILAEARALSGADAGSLFLCSDKQLEFVVAQNQTLSQRLGVDKLSGLFRRTTLPLDESSIAGYVASTATPVNLPDARHISPRLPFRHNALFDEQHDYETRSLLAVPLKDPGGQVLGVLQLINCTDDHGTVIAFSQETQQLMLIFASMAAVALRLHQGN
jgi:hypothetical protein